MDLESLTKALPRVEEDGAKAVQKPEAKLTQIELLSKIIMKNKSLKMRCTNKTPNIRGTFGNKIHKNKSNRRTRLSGSSSREDAIAALKSNFYLCPLDNLHNCDFFTTREGFENGLAAKHLTVIHKLTAADMTVPEKFKFQKLKGEKLLMLRH